MFAPCCGVRHGCVRPAGSRSSSPSGRWRPRASVGRKRVSGNSNSANPALSRDGLLVSFESDATNLIKKDTNGNRDIFAHVLSVPEDPPLVTIEFGDARPTGLSLR